MDDQDQSSSSTATTASNSASETMVSSIGSTSGSQEDLTAGVAVSGPSISTGIIRGSSSATINNNRLTSTSANQNSTLNPNNSLTRELLFLIFRFLEGCSCEEAAEVLGRHLESQDLLPRQYNWRTGATLPRIRLKDVRAEYRHISADHLLKVMKKSCQAIAQISPPPVPGIESLLSAGRFSMLRSIEKKDPLKSCPQDEPLPLSHSQVLFLINHRNHAPLVPSSRYYRAFPGSVVSALISREMSGPKPVTHILPTRCYHKYHHYRRVLGHLSGVYCVMFDNTSRFIITGSDDKLIKIWSTEDGRLLMTLRGHLEEITDITIGMYNIIVIFLNDNC